jgi:pimeloyl-ACP methyl ester carboxylesterase
MRKTTILIYVAVAAIVVIPYIAAGWSELPVDEKFRQQAPGDFIELSTGKIHYRWLGPQSGEIIVLVHGVSVPQYIFSQTAAALVDSGYRVLLFDHFGHGYSDRPVAQYDADFFDQQMVGILDALELDEPVNIGALSMGGVIAADFTARHPEERVRSLTLFAPAGLRLVNDSDSAFVTLLKAPLIGNWLWRIISRDFYFPEDDESTAVEDIVSEESLQGVPEQQADYAGYLMAQRQIFRHLRLSHREDLLLTIDKTSVPVLGIFGDADETISIESATLLADLIPRARVEIIQGGTHHLNIHKWREVRDLMLSFLHNNGAAQLPRADQRE